MRGDDSPNQAAKDLKNAIRAVPASKLHLYYIQRFRMLGHENWSELARLLDMTRQQLNSLMKGRAPVSPTMVERFNEIDPEYELIGPLYLLVKRKGKR